MMRHRSHSASATAYRRRGRRIRQWSWGVIAYSMVLLAAYAACAAALTVDGDDHAAMLEKTNRDRGHDPHQRIAQAAA